MKYPLVIAFILGCGFTFFTALAWSLVLAVHRGLKKMLED